MQQSHVKFALETGRWRAQEIEEQERKRFITIAPRSFAAGVLAFLEELERSANWWQRVALRTVAAVVWPTLNSRSRDGRADPAA